MKIKWRKVHWWCCVHFNFLNHITHKPDSTCTARHPCGCVYRVNCDSFKAFHPRLTMYNDWPKGERCSHE